MAVPIRIMVDPAAMASAKSSDMPIDRHSIVTLSYFFFDMSTERFEIS